jgi:phytoene dehydrogenase-like protein
LAGLTVANCLAKHGRSVLLLEQHFQLGGLAAWFKRPGGFLFDISLHGFPCGMIKSCRRYWNRQMSEAIVQLKTIRFENPQFRLQTPFDRQDFTQQLTEHFGVSPRTVGQFFTHLRQMNFYDRDSRTIRELFDEFFPGRDDVHRLLLEPIAYANGSTLEDPAIAYGIVFSNFMHGGVFTFRGGTDRFVGWAEEELRHNGVEIARRATVERIFVESRKGEISVDGVGVDGVRIGCRTLISNANLKTTVEDWLPPGAVPEDFLRRCRSVRVNSGSCQVYIGLRANESIEDVGDLIFVSANEHFSSDELKSRRTKSRTFSIYYPSIRPDNDEPRYTIVSSTNALWRDWAELSPEAYTAEKKSLIEETLNDLERFIPDVRARVGWVEAATPKTFHRYTRHIDGSSFGTKFEGLGVSTDLPKQVRGLFHAGSVGIIMSGWLGAINYGVIVADKAEKYLLDTEI